MRGINPINIEIIRAVNGFYVHEREGMVHVRCYTQIFPRRTFAFYMRHRLYSCAESLTRYERDIRNDLSS